MIRYKAVRSYCEVLSGIPEKVTPIIELRSKINNTTKDVVNGITSNRFYFDPEN